MARGGNTEASEAVASPYMYTELCMCEGYILDERCPLQIRSRDNRAGVRREGKILGDTAQQPRGNVATMPSPDVSEHFLLV